MPPRQRAVARAAAPDRLRVDGTGGEASGADADELARGARLSHRRVLARRALNLIRIPERRRGAMPSEAEAAALRFSLPSNGPLLFARGCGRSERRRVGKGWVIECKSCGLSVH